MLKAELEAEVVRLRARTHELAHKADLETSRLVKRLAKWEVAAERAQETLKKMHADWTTDPPALKDNGFWRYSSIATKDALIYLMTLVQEAEAERDKWRLAAVRENE